MTLNRWRILCPLMQVCKPERKECIVERTWIAGIRDLAHPVVYTTQSLNKKCVYVLIVLSCGIPFLF